MADDVVEAARNRILDAHGDVVRGVVAVADAVAAAWDDPAASGDGSAAAGDDFVADPDFPATADRAAVVEPLRAELRARGLLDRMPAVLADAADAAGYDLPAEPVAAPPYVVVTGRGPVLRGTVADGRLVVVLTVFRVERDPVRYVRAGDDPAEVVEVVFVPDSSETAPSSDD